MAQVVSETMIYNSESSPVTFPCKRIRKTLCCKVTSHKLNSHAITSCAPYNLPQKCCSADSHMGKLEQTIGFGKQPFPRLYLASSLPGQQFTEMTNLSQAEHLLSRDILVNSL